MFQLAPSPFPQISFDLRKQARGELHFSFAAIPENLHLSIQGNEISRHSNRQK